MDTSNNKNNNYINDVYMTEDSDGMSDYMTEDNLSDSDYMTEDNLSDSDYMTEDTSENMSDSMSENTIDNMSDNMSNVSDYTSNVLDNDSLTDMDEDIICSKYELDHIVTYNATKNIVCLNADNFRSYLEQVIYKDPDACNVKTWINYHISIDLYNFTYSHSIKFENDIRLCLADNNSRRFIFVPIKLSAPGLDHANLIIIDNVNRTIEYFEPYGDISTKQNFNTIGDNNPIQLEHVGFDYTIADMIHTVLKHFFPKRVGGRDNYMPYKFINVQGTKYGLQWRGERARKERNKNEGMSENIIGGYCMAWCLLYAHLRIHCKLLNYDEIVKDINNKLYDYPFLIEHFITKIELDLNPKVEHVACITDLELKNNSIIDICEPERVKKFNEYLVNAVMWYFKEIKEGTLDITKLQNYNRYITRYINYSQFYPLYFEGINVAWKEMQIGRKRRKTILEKTEKK